MPWKIEIAEGPWASVYWHSDFHQERDAWSSVNNAKDELMGLRIYLSRWPSGGHAAEARRRVEECRKREWKALDKTSTTAVDKYLSRYLEVGVPMVRDEQYTALCRSPSYVLIPTGICERCVLVWRTDGFVPRPAYTKFKVLPGLYYEGFELRRRSVPRGTGHRDGDWDESPFPSLDPQDLLLMDKSELNRTLELLRKKTKDDNHSVDMRMKNNH